MTSFIDLQTCFAATELSALGVVQNLGQTMQPALVPTAGDDASLWALFNAIPQPGSFYRASGNKFFDAYSSVIQSLAPGDGPLDPIVIAKRKLAEWGNAAPRWSLGYTQMTKQLKSAPPIEFPFESKAKPSPGYWGLCGNSPADGGPSAAFADGHVSATIRFSHCLNFSPTPGDWYVSSALSLAYAVKEGKPWTPGSPVTWQSTFGSGGSLANFLASMIVVSGIKLGYTSTTVFGAADQATIRAGMASGLWPYYLVGTADLAFDTTGCMTVEMTTTATQPTIIVASVLTAAQYLGRS